MGRCRRGHVCIQGAERARCHISALCDADVKLLQSPVPTTPSLEQKDRTHMGEAPDGRELCVTAMLSCDSATRSVAKGRIHRERGVGTYLSCENSASSPAAAPLLAPATPSVLELASASPPTPWRPYPGVSSRMPATFGTRWQQAAAFACSTQPGSVQGHVRCVCECM